MYTASDIPPRSPSRMGFGRPPIVDDQGIWDADDDLADHLQNAMLPPNYESDEERDSNVYRRLEPDDSDDTSEFDFPLPPAARPNHPLYLPSLTSCTQSQDLLTGEDDDVNLDLDVLSLSARVHLPSPPPSAPETLVPHYNEDVPNDPQYLPSIVSDTSMASQCPAALYHGPSAACLRQLQRFWSLKNDLRREQEWLENLQDAYSGIVEGAEETYGAHPQPSLSLPPSPSLALQASNPLPSPRPAIEPRTFPCHGTLAALHDPDKKPCYDEVEHGVALHALRQRELQQYLQQAMRDREERLHQERLSEERRRMETRRETKKKRCRNARACSPPSSPLFPARIPHSPPSSSTRLPCSPTLPEKPFPLSRSHSPPSSASLTWTQIPPSPPRSPTQPSTVPRTRRNYAVAAVVLTRPHVYDEEFEDGAHLHAESLYAFGADERDYVYARCTVPGPQWVQPLGRVAGY